MERSLKSQALKRLWTIAKQVQTERRSLHKGQATTRILTSDGDAMGVYGEMLFGGMIGMPADLSPRVAGDDGDFATPLGIMDVKTASRDYGLAVPVDLLKPDWIYILAIMNKESLIVTIEGWAWGHEIRDYPISQLTENGPRNYLCPSSNLRSIRVLQELMSAAGRIGLYEPLTKRQVFDRYMAWQPQEKGGDAK